VSGVAVYNCGMELILDLLFEIVLGAARFIGRACLGVLGLVYESVRGRDSYKQ